MRAHLIKTLTDATGAVLLNCSVRVLQPGTTTLLMDTLWSDATTTTQPLSNPFTAANGMVDFYLDTSQRVRLGVTPPGVSEVFFEDIDALEPPAADTDIVTKVLEAAIADCETLEVIPADVSDTAETAVILRDSSGARWKITVNTSGTVVTTAL